MSHSRPVAVIPWQGLWPRSGRPPDPPKPPKVPRSADRGVADLLCDTSLLRLEPKEPTPYETVVVACRLNARIGPVASLSRSCLWVLSPSPPAKSTTQSSTPSTRRLDRACHKPSTPGRFLYSFPSFSPPFSFPSSSPLFLLLQGRSFFPSYVLILQHLGLRLGF